VQTRTDSRVADLTTLRVGGPARRVLEVATEDDLVASVLSCAPTEPLLIIGGGSNLLVADGGFPGTVVLVRTVGVDAKVDSCAGVWLSVAAGESWDALVARTVAAEWIGLEALSGIPGLVGAAPIQNIGAYGQQVADTIARVRTLDRLTGARATYAGGDCGFGYRTSMFKREPGRHLVLGVEFQLTQASRSVPIRYLELARALGVDVGDRAPLAAVRAAVLGLRAAKAMLLDPEDHDTWSAGSFFLNPLISADQAALLPATAPRFDQPDGTVKTSAAWLIEHSGFGRGYPGVEATARLSTRHTLAITNRGTATTGEILALARELRDGVRARFAIDLEPEPTLVGCSLD
jgi:UDP-N-acetylmuramate dehydrogenase